MVAVCAVAARAIGVGTEGAVCVVFVSAAVGAGAVVAAVGA